MRNLRRKSLAAPTANDIFHRTWEEVCELANAGLALRSIEGFELCGPDKRFDTKEAFSHYARSVQTAYHRVPHFLPDIVKQQHEERLAAFENGNTTAMMKPMEKQTGPVILNAKGKPFSWSWSAINDYETCPFQYAAKRFFCTVVEDQNEANIWGNRVHKASEDHMKSGKAMDGEFKDLAKYPVALRKWALRHNLVIDPEAKFCVSQSLKPTSWFGKDAWGRGIIDVLLISPDGKKAWIIDWKTGKVKPDSAQLRYFIALASTRYPDIQTYSTKFVWMKYDDVTGEDYTADQLPDIWAELLGRVNRVKKAWDDQVFPCKPSGLCNGWCPVKACQHYKG